MHKHLKYYKHKINKNTITVFTIKYSKMYQITKTEYLYNIKLMKIQANLKNRKQRTIIN